MEEGCREGRGMEEEKREGEKRDGGMEGGEGERDVWRVSIIIICHCSHPPSLSM
jgi:hypothetical protein